jgi:hypothetical protein
MFRFRGSDSSTNSPNDQSQVERPEFPAPPIRAVNSDGPCRLIPLTEAQRFLPRHAGKHIHRTTLGRWASKGCRGIVLETCMVGGLRYTTVEAIAEFVRLLTAASASARQAGTAIPAKGATASSVPTTLPDTGPCVSRRDRIEANLKRFGF